MSTRHPISNKKVRLAITLKEYLDSQGLTLYTLGKWVKNISPQTVYAIANNTRKPSIDALEEILTALRANGYDTKLADLIKVGV